MRRRVVITGLGAITPYGAAGAVATVMAIREGFIHPTINYENPDPECDLDYVPNRGRVKSVDFALCNSMASGSGNSALVLGRHGTEDLRGRRF